MAARPRDFLLLLKPGIVASNALTAAAAFALAASSPAGILPTLLGTASLVAGSCALNNWIDRDIDRLMERTRDRPTAAGRIGAGLAIGLGLLLLLAGELALLTRGPLPAGLGLAGAFFYVGPYSLWTKRRSRASSLVGGLAGASPPLIGWTAAGGALGLEALLLFAFLLVWQQAHVRALALARGDEYRAASLPMAGLDDRGDGSLDPVGAGVLLAWILALFPFPFLLAAAGSIALHPLAAIPQAACILLWLAIGKGAARPEAPARGWGRLMFVLSLACLAIFFAGVAAGRAGP